MNYREELLVLINNSSKEIADYVLLKYFDSNKYLYNLYVEAYKDLECFTTLFANNIIPQSATILRMAIENVVTILFIQKYPTILIKYAEFVAFRFQIKNFTSGQQRKKVFDRYKEERNFSEKDALKFIDYGWTTYIDGITTKNYGIKRMAELVEFNDVTDLIDTLNMFVHGTLTQANISTINIDDFYKSTKTLFQICLKLYDHLAYNLIRVTGDEITIPNILKYKHYLEVYKNYMDLDENTK